MQTYPTTNRAGICIWALPNPAAPIPRRRCVASTPTRRDAAVRLRSIHRHFPTAERVEAPAGGSPPPQMEGGHASGSQRADSSNRRVAHRAPSRDLPLRKLAPREPLKLALVPAQQADPHRHCRHCRQNQTRPPAHPDAPSCSKPGRKLAGASALAATSGKHRGNVADGSGAFGERRDPVPNGPRQLEEPPATAGGSSNR
jgi:hypothetical protein